MYGNKLKFESLTFRKLKKIAKIYEEFILLSLSEIVKSIWMLNICYQLLHFTLITFIVS